MKTRIIILLLVLLVPSLALAIPVNLEVRVLVPPALDLGPRTSVAVGELDGWNADAVRTSILHALADGERGVTVAVEEPAGQPGGIVIAGTVPELEVVDDIEDIEVERQRGPVTTQETDHKLTRTVTLSFEMEALDVDTGELRGTQHFDISIQHEGKQRRAPEECLEAARDPEDMAAEMMEAFGYRVADYVTPRWTEGRFDLERNGDTAPGVNLAKQERDLVAATDWFVRNAAKNSYDEWLHFDAAVMLAVTHHYDASAESLATAQAIKDRPRFRTFAARLETLRAGFEQLRAMGVELEPLEYAGAAGPLADAETVTVKGGRNKTFPLTSEPGGGSVVVEVPGGMTLLELERSGDHVRVRTHDGKEGWLPAKKVK